jgi:hypothetical protein
MANYRYVPLALMPLKKQKLFNNIAVFDIETTSWPDDTEGLTETEKNSWHNRRIEPFLVLFADERRRLFWEGPDCLIRFLKDHLVHANRRLVTFAHNGGKFDFIALYETLVRDPDLSKKFFVKPFLAHGRIIALTVHDHHKHVWHFRDSYALLLASLADLSRSFQPAHQKLVRPLVPYPDAETCRRLDRNELKSSLDEEARDAWVAYGMNDCLALYDILRLFNETIRDVGGCMGYTIASTAMLTFRRKFLTQEIPNYFAYNNLLRQAYYGGRVEIFTMHAPEQGRPYYYYDVNSEYPAVMYESSFPVTRPRSVRYRHAEDCRGRCGIMEASVIAPEDLSLPVLPYREPVSGKLLFPLGQWNAWYPFPLVEKALDLGYTVKPLRCYEFGSAEIFREYVSRFYQLKQESTGATRETMKRLLNSLYGKFGEHQEREELVTDPDEDITGAYPYDEVFGYSIRKFVRFSAYHLPAIAAYVTALAQLKIYGYLCAALRAGGRLFYTDTDSLVTDVRLPTSRDLGGLKLEHEIRRAVFLAPKTYCLTLYDDEEEKIVLKGFSPVSRHRLGYLAFEEALLTGDLSRFTEETIQPASLKTIHVRHLGGFVTVLQKKSLGSWYDKRIIHPDFTTSPLTVPLPEKKTVVVPDTSFIMPELQKSERRKSYERSHPLDMNERRLLDRLLKISDHPKNYLLRCIRLAADADIDIEMEVDWEQGEDPIEQIHRLLQPQKRLFFDGV